MNHINKNLYKSVPFIQFDEFGIALDTIPTLRQSYIWNMYGDHKVGSYNFEAAYEVVSELTWPNSLVDSVGLL